MSYVVTLSGLPPLTFETVEEVWDCNYLGPRKPCSCPQGCRCAMFERFKAKLEAEGKVKLFATTVYRELPR